jgi:hypothetical protein
MPVPIYRLLASMVCTLFLFSTPDASAALEQLKIFGQITRVGGDGKNIYSLTRGDTFSAFVTYDNAVVSTPYSNSPSGFFAFPVKAFGFNGTTFQNQSNQYSAIALIPATDSSGAQVSFYANNLYGTAPSFSDVLNFTLPALSSTINSQTNNLADVRYQPGSYPMDLASFYFAHNNLDIGGIPGTVQYTGYINNIVISPVPEPSQITLMLSGLFLLLGLRRHVAWRRAI